MSALYLCHTYLMEHNSTLDKMETTVVQGQRPLAMRKDSSQWRSLCPLRSMSPYDKASLGLLIPLIQLLQGNVTTFLDPGTGHADILPAMLQLVQRVQVDTEFCLELLTKQTPHVGDLV